VTDVVRGGGFKLFASAELVKGLACGRGGPLAQGDRRPHEFVKIYGAQGWP
jgi:aspartyl-tRNA synthetase